MTPIRKSRAKPPVVALGDLAQHADAASQLMKALSNPNRLMILCTLNEGELSVGMLNERLPLSQSALSQHLAVLRAAELVYTRREAQTIYYGLSAGPAMEVIRVLHDHFCDEPGNNR